MTTEERRALKRFQQALSQVGFAADHVAEVFKGGWPIRRSNSDEAKPREIQPTKTWPRS